MKGFREEGNALIWAGKGEIVQIEPWGKDSLRVRATQGAGIQGDLPGGLLEPVAQRATTEIAASHARIQNGSLAAEINDRGIIHFLNTSTGAVLLEEDAPLSTDPDWPPARSYQALSGGMYKIEARFRAYDDERIHGLGQQRHGRLDHKGCVIELLHRNTIVSIPFLLSSRGYGFLWHNPAVGRVELAMDRTRWVAEACHQLDYWITAGRTPAEILEHYVDATGHAPVIPAWATGFWQSKLRYSSQEELLSVAREYRRRGLPLSVIVIDFFHWTVQGEWKFDPEKWPDPAAMVRELEGIGVKVMVSIWPTVNELSSNYEEMRERGLLVRAVRGVPVQMIFQDNRPAGPVALHYYDATNPEARQFLWDKVRQNYYRHGIKVWWLDEAEPEIVPLHPDNLDYHLGNGQSVTNIYPMMYARGFYEGMRAEGEEEVISLCRCAWAGSQRYGAAVWSGDIQSTFEELQIQVRAGLNMGLSGIPWWTTDIGGFFNGDPASPSFRELIVRWFQYGTFCPLFRLHGFREPTSWRPVMHGGPNEVWSFGDEAYAIISELLFLRERLRPYIMQQMILASGKGIPPMRPLFFDFPGDPECTRVDDQFMFGPDILVAPVLFEGMRNRKVYLPSGATWRDPWKGQSFEGGRWITVDAPLERIPLYLRDTAMLPIAS